MKKEVLVQKIIDTAKRSNLNIKYSGSEDFTCLLFDVDFKQPFEYVEVVFSGILKQEEFQLHFASLYLSERNNSLGQFKLEIDRAYELVLKLNEYLRPLRGVRVRHTDEK